MSPRRTAAALAAVTLLTVACGRLSGDGPGGDDTIPHPTGTDDLVLRVETGGGFVAPEYTLSAAPGLSIYGDDRLIQTGPMIEIYPGPALPNLLVIPLSEATVQTILAAAREAGLMDGDASYGYDCVADAATTTFTVTADGHTSVVSAYALGMEAGGGDCPGTDVEARAVLSAFQVELQRLVSESGSGSEEPYTPTEMRVFVLPYRGDQPDLPQEPVEWPLEVPLSTFGAPIEVPQDARCGVVSGTDLETLLPAAQAANQLTPWVSGGAEYSMIFRPLLPDEHGC